MALTNRVAVIIGASGQLGPAVTTAFANAGARLVLVGTHETELDKVFKELGYRESRVMKYVADALDPAAMQELAQAVKTRFGRVDILLHLAGAYLGGNMMDTPDEAWNTMLDVNLRTAIHATRAFVPHLRMNEWGRIITISSGITQAPPPNSIAYVTAKGALETMTVALAQEVKDQHITANTVLIRALESNSESSSKKNGSVKPEDVAATLLFLCSDEAGAINGARIPVFGNSV